MHRLQELVRLHRKGVGYRKIARLLKMSPNTERKYRRALEATGMLQGDPDDIPPLEKLKEIVTDKLPSKSPPQQTSTVEQFRDDIERMMDRGAGPTAIYDRLRLERDEFDGSLSAIKRLCLRIKKERGISPEDVVIPVETAPGEIAQVDFGYVGKLFDEATGRVRKAYAFVMVLGFSRMMYVDLVFDQKVETWLRLHVDAFEYFGGVPKTIVPDNLKAAVTRCYFGLKDKPELNRSYRELARHYGVMIDPTPPYAPEKKGKVEACVKYVKNNFFGPRSFERLDEAKPQLAVWLDEIANARTHGTTKQVPEKRFDEIEREQLGELPDQPFELTIWKQANVHPDSHVEFERRLYSVPFVHIGKKVFVRARGNSVDIFCDDERVATHRRRGSRYSTNNAHLPEHRRDLRHRSEEWWQNKADEISPIVGEYVKEIFESDRVLSQLRTVQSIVSYLQQFPTERAEAACERARMFGNYSYQCIKKILVDGIDMEPVVNEVTYVHGKLDDARFARHFTDLTTRGEGTDECN